MDSQRYSLRGGTVPLWNTVPSVLCFIPNSTVTLCFRLASAPARINLSAPWQECHRSPIHEEEETR